MGNQLVIAHRGNTAGVNPRHENMPDYILEALNQGFDAECDLWKIGEELFLGHDKPQYKVEWDFLIKRPLWVHCKNIEAAHYAVKYKQFHTFCHQKDDFALTSGGYLWTYPGKPLTDKSIAVLPETVPDWDISIAYGICTDYPIRYKTEMKKQ